MVTSLEQAAQAESNFSATIKAAKEEYRQFLLTSGYQLIEYSDYDSKYSYYVHPDFLEAAQAAMGHWDLSLDDMCEFLKLEELPNGAVIQAC